MDLRFGRAYRLRALPSARFELLSPSLTPLRPVPRKPVTPLALPLFATRQGFRPEPFFLKTNSRRFG